MSEHTPGPWEALRREGPFGEVWDVLARNLGPDYDATSSRWIAEDRSEADARLIAAAPLMADFVYTHAARGDKEALAILETAGVSPHCAALAASNADLLAVLREAVAEHVGTAEDCEPECWSHRAREAIAKATEGNPQ